MPVCPACYSFVEEGIKLCPQCDGGLEAAGVSYGRELIGTVHEGEQGLSPTRLILAIAATPICWFLAVTAFGDETVARAPLVPIFYAIMGGLSVGGLANMLIDKGRGYTGRDRFAWWACGGTTILTPLAMVIATLISPKANALPAGMVFGCIQVAVLITSLTFIPGNLRAGRIGIRSGGSWICLAWVLGFGIVLGISIFWS